MHARRFLAISIAMLMTLALFVPFAGAQAPAEGPPTDDPATAAELGAGYLARQIGPDGTLPNPFSDEPSVGEAIDAGLALSVAGVGTDALDRVTSFVLDSYEDYVRRSGQDQAGALGKTAMFAVAVGLDPTSFGSEDDDLLTRIEGTRTTNGPDEGLYNAPNIFGSTVTQAYALLGYAAAGEAPHPTAVTWLVEQQCPDGGFKGYRSPAERAAGECDPDPADFTGQNVDATAFAVQALVAVGGDDAAIADAVADAIAWLRGAQNADDAGFGNEGGDETSANSTAVAIQAIIAAGGDPTSAAWQRNGTNPLATLLGLQLGCDAAGAERGAFTFFGEASNFSTYQAVWGAALAPLPFGPTSAEAIAAAPFPACPLDVTRVAGTTRIQTAAEIALETFPEGTDTVVVAFGYNFADALAGAPLATAEEAPILLSERDRLSPAAAEAIRELGAERVILLGGDAALSEAVAEQAAAIEGVGTVDRISGPNRFATAAAIAAELDADTVYIAEGANPNLARGWPDALAVSALAAFEGRPILLVTAGTLPGETRTALDGFDNAVVVGGDAAVGPEVYAAIDAEVEDVTRVSGRNRFETAFAISGLARAAGMDPTVTWFATGGAFADALAAGPAVAARGDVLMLVAGQAYENSPATAAYVRDVAFTLDEIIAVGGTAAVADATVEAIAADARGAEAR